MSWYMLILYIDQNTRPVTSDIYIYFDDKCIVFTFCYGQQMTKQVVNYNFNPYGQGCVGCLIIFNNLY